MFLARKRSDLLLEGVIIVLEFPAFALQAVVLLLEMLFLVPELPVRALEVVVLSLEGLVQACVLELRVVTLKSLHILLDRVGEAPFTSE